MMEDHEFCDECPGCRPAMMSESGVRVADDDPLMIKINKVWDTQTTFAERKAFIEVTLKNCRNEHEMQLAQQVVYKIQQAIATDD